MTLSYFQTLISVHFCYTYYYYSLPLHLLLLLFQVVVGDAAHLHASAADPMNPSKSRRLISRMAAANGRLRCGFLAAPVAGPVFWRPWGRLFAGCLPPVDLRAE